MKTIKREIMKTNIKTLATICILGFIGAINVNAANLRNADNNLVVEEAKSTKNELAKAEGSIGESTVKTSFETDARFESIQFFLNEDLDSKIDLQREAQSVTKWIVDQEEAKLTQKFIAEVKFDKPESIQFPLSKDSYEKINFQKEAQLVTKLIADQEESKVIKKLIDEGKLGEIN